jgi:hypothetical protein
MTIYWANAQLRFCGDSMHANQPRSRGISVPSLSLNAGYDGINIEGSTYGLLICATCEGHGLFVVPLRSEAVNLAGSSLRYARSQCTAKSGNGMFAGAMTRNDFVR